jgi:hypothetical protein
MYNPIFQALGFGLTKVLLLVSVLYLMYNKTARNFLFYFKSEFIITILIIIYILPFVFFGNGTATVLPYQHFIWLLESFIIPLFFVFGFKSIFKEDSYVKVFIAVGFVASLITIYLLINPAVNIWVRSSLIIDSLDIIDSDFDFRGFSLSEGSSFDYGIMQGIILSMCLLNLRKSFLYAIPILPLFISILFNARIGFSVVIITLVLMLIHKRINFRAILGTTIVCFVAFQIYNTSSLVSVNNSGLEWGLSFFEDTFNFLKGDSSDSNYGVLSDDMLIFPSNVLSLLFGEGRSLFGLDNGGSDIGYVNQIFAGGIVYLSILFSFQFYLFKKYNYCIEDKLFFTILFLTLLVVNIKGNAFFVSVGFTRFIILYLIISLKIYNDKRIE